MIEGNKQITLFIRYFGGHEYWKTSNPEKTLKMVKQISLYQVQYAEVSRLAYKAVMNAIIQPSKDGIYTPVLD